MMWVMTVAGLLILLLAGDALVKGAVNLSLRIGVPALIVGLTVVAFGTSAPELLISVQAVLADAPGIALGNVVGSNTANILLVLGIPALMVGLHTGAHDTRKSYLVMIAGSLLFIALAFRGVIGWTSGLVLLAALVLILGEQFLDARRHRANAAAADDVEELEGADPRMPTWKVAAYIVLGLIGLPLGADLFVDGSVQIARVFGVSETVIGLTLVAIGTSLPELATTVAAALRKQADVALGNVIGSNMFNLLAIIGVASLVGPIPVDAQFLRLDLWVMLGASLLIGPYVFLRWNMGRVTGALFCVLYLAYLVAVIV